MRIIMLVHSLRRGGAERVLLETALGLQNKGHEVKVISWIDIDDYSDKCYSSIKREFLISKDSYKWIRSIPKSSALLKIHIRNFNPEVIEIHTPNTLLLVSWAKLSIPCVYVIHGFGSISKPITQKGKILQYLMRSSLKQLSSINVVVSMSMIQQAASFFKIKSENFLIIPNGVDYDKFKYNKKIPRNEVIILMLGTLCDNKGQLHGLRSFALLQKYLPNSTLWIVGDGPSRFILEQTAKELNLLHKITFWGQRDDVHELMSQSDILWQLSKSEGMPMAILEAMATGLPVIGFNVRGISDLIIDGKTGLLSEYLNVDSIAYNTKYLVDNINLYLSFSETCRNLIESEFSLGKMIEKHHEVLTYAINKHE